MEATLEFRGTGRGLFQRLVLGVLLTIFSAGIYLPWSIVDLTKYIYENTIIKRSGRGDLLLHFDGHGTELFKLILIGGLLSVLTIGIYIPWFATRLHRFFLEHSRGRANDGDFRLSSELSGLELAKTMWLGGALTAITLGVYSPWLICNLHALLLRSTRVHSSGVQVIGGAHFAGKGADLLVLMIVNLLFTAVTLGIYFPWMQINVFKFFASHSELRVRGQTYRGELTGSGGDYLTLLLSGYLLTVLTCGLYSFWFVAKLLKFQLENLKYRTAQAAAIEVPLPRMALPRAVAGT